MAVAVKAVGTVYETSGGTNPIQPVIPGTPAAGDLMVAIISTHMGMLNTWSVTSGWTEVYNIATNGTIAIFWKAWQSGDGTPSFTPDRSDIYSGAIILISGADTSSPFDVSCAGSDFSAPGSPYDVTIPTFNTNTDGALAGLVWASEDNNNWDYTEAGGGTQQISYSTESGLDHSWCVATKAMATAGAVGAQTARQTNKVGDAGQYAYFAIKPSGVSTLTTDKTDTGLITESAAVAVSAQTTLTPGITDTGVLTEDVLLAVINNITISESAILVEQIDIEVSAQPTLEIGSTDIIVLIEARDISLSSPVLIEIGIDDAIVLTEDKDISLSVQPDLEIPASDSIVLIEDISSEISVQPDLVIDNTDIILITETSTVEKEGEVADRNVSSIDQLIQTEEPQVSVSAQPVLAPEITEIALITESSDVEVEQQPTLSPQVTENAVLVEAVEAYLALTNYNLSVIDPGVISESINALVSSQTVLAPSISEAISLVEDIDVAISEQLTLSIGGIDEIIATESVEVYSSAMGEDYIWLRRRRRT